MHYFGESKERKRLLAQSVEERMKSIHAKLTLALTFCKTVETELRFGHDEKARELLIKLQKTAVELSAHIQSAHHVSHENSKEFSAKLQLLQERVAAIDLRVRESARPN
jgi:hypothetical protein